MRAQRHPIPMALVLISTLFMGTPAPVTATDPTTYYVLLSNSVEIGDGSSCSEPHYVETAASDDDAIIQAAINAASPGDTIYLCAGTYDIGTTLALGSKTVTLQGAGAESTILDGGTDTRILIGDTMTVSGLTFQNGFIVGSGGAIYADMRATVSASRFINNRATQDGGAVFVPPGTTETLLISSSTFADNRAETGGAVSAWTDAVVTGSTFIRNIADETGGAIWSDTAVIRLGSFSENHAEYGGAVNAVNSATVERSSFTRNVATSYAGALLAPTGLLSSSEFSLNRAGERAGAVLLYDVAASDLNQMRRNRFTRNASGRAGAINLERCGMAPTLAEGRRVERANTFIGNRASVLRRTANIERTMEDC